MARRHNLLNRCAPTRIDSVLQVLRALSRTDIIAITSDEHAGRMRAAELLAKAEDHLRSAGLMGTASPSQADTHGSQQVLCLFHSAIRKPI